MYEILKGNCGIKDTLLEKLHSNLMINDFQNLCIINQIEQHGVLYKSAIFMKST